MKDFVHTLHCIIIVLTMHFKMHLLVEDATTVSLRAPIHEIVSLITFSPVRQFFLTRAIIINAACCFDAKT